jgi:polysaccharide biosynthesis protein PslH
MSKKVRILYIASHWPFWKSYGAQLRVVNIGGILKRIGELSFVFVSFDKTKIDNKSIDMCCNEYGLKYIANLIPDKLTNPLKRIRHEVDPTYLNTQGLSISKNDKQIMLKLINENDVIWLHTAQTANVFQIYKWPHSVLDIDDVKSRLHTSFARSEKNIIKKLIQYRRAIIWKRRELDFKKRFDVFTVTNNEDRRYLGEDSNIEVVPNGFNIPKEVLTFETKMPSRIGFIGTFDWLPNKNGMKWFIKNVWPIIKKTLPDLRLRIVGKGSDVLFCENEHDIEGLGWIEDPGLEIASWSAIVIPIHEGGGTRVKIAEAFCRKCPVVSTEIGVSGYEVKNEEDLFIANNEEEFARACILLVKDEALRRKIAENAWNKAITKWTWNSIEKDVNNVVLKCLSL